MKEDGILPANITSEPVVAISLSLSLTHPMSTVPLSGANHSCICYFPAQTADGPLSYATFRRCIVENTVAVVHGAADAFVVAPELRSEAHEPAITSVRRLLSPEGLQEVFGDLRCHPCPVYRFDDTGSAASAHECGAENLGCAEQTTLQDAVDAWTHSRDATGRSSLWYVKDWHFQLGAEKALKVRLCDTQASPPQLAVGSDAASAIASYEPQRCLAMYRIPPFLGPDLVHGFYLDSLSYRSLSSVGPSSAPGVDSRASERDNADAAGGDPTPLFFGTGRSDYRFAYVGAEGTWTPLHHDVFGTFSWSLNVAGKKLWYFLEPKSQRWAEQNFRRHGLPLPPDIRVMSHVELVSLVQDVGDLVFVPSGWYHQVHNVEGEVMPCGACASQPTTQPLVVSINHNWMSPDQLGRMTATFVDEVTALLQMIGSDRDSFEPLEWRDMLERMLLGGGNWNFSTMNRFLDYCASQIEYFGECADVRRRPYENEARPERWVSTQRDCAGLRFDEAAAAEAVVWCNEWTNIVAECVAMVKRCEAMALSTRASSANRSP